MKKLTLLLLSLLFVRVGYSQELDSTVNATSRSYSGKPHNKIAQAWLDTNLYMQVDYKEYADDSLIIRETLILELDFDSVKVYYPVIYNRLMTRFFNSVQRSEYIFLSKEAAKERFFGYSKFFK